MFYASGKVEQSSLNGLNSFRTCLIALVEYAMVSAFFHFLFHLDHFYLWTSKFSQRAECRGADPLEFCLPNVHPHSTKLTSFLQCDKIQ